MTYEFVLYATWEFRLGQIREAMANGDYRRAIFEIDLMINGYKSNCRELGLLKAECHAFLGETGEARRLAE